MQRATITQTAETFKRVGYNPQHLAPFHNDRERRIKLLSGGEGAGKSLGAAFEVIAEFPFWDLVYIVAPKYEAAKKEFEYIKEALLLLKVTNAALISNPSKGQRSLTTIFGQRVITLSAEDGVDAVTGTGESPNIVLMVECGKQSFDIFLACRGRVARSRGILILSGTIEQSNRWYPELIERWQAENPEGAKAYIVPTWDNRALYPGGRTDPEIVALERTYPPDRFLERFGAIPCKPSDLVIKEFEFLRHVREDVQYNPSLPCELWIDPGYSGSHYALEVVQFPNARDVYIIDEIFADHATTQEVIETAKTKTWWGNIKGGTCDIAAKAHAAMPSVWEVWNAADVAMATNAVPIAEGVELHRTFLKPPDGSEPRLFFNPACKGAFGEYGSWKRKQVGENLTEPSAHNCDAMKAIHYGLYERFGALGARVTRHEKRLEDMYAELP